MTSSAITGGSFRLLEPANKKHDSFELGIRVGGYNATMHYIAHLIKVSIMALEGKADFCSRLIPEPAVNISGVLELVLNMIPYEEAELLDVLYKEYLDGKNFWSNMSAEEMEIRIVPVEIWEMVGKG